MKNRQKKSGFCFALILSCALLPTMKIASEENLSLPQDYHEVAYMDCGSARKTAGGSEPVISQDNGESYAFPGISGIQGTAAFAEDILSFTISGLKENASYTLAFTWWDADNRGRVQSVHCGDTVLVPPTPAKAFLKDQPTWAQVLLPGIQQFAQNGSLTIQFRKDSGPNVVVSEIRLLERSAASDKKQILIVTGDDYPGHVWRETAPELAAILREDSRLEVSITEAPAILGSPLLHQYDAVLFHFKNYTDRLPLGKEVQTGLENYVAAGKGLVFVHFGCGAFQEWPGFVNVAGRIWNPKLRGHDKYGPFKVNIIDKDHPITAAMADFDTEDELYTCLDGTPPIRVLCESTSVVDKKNYPMGFVLPQEGKRVFHCTLGHDQASLKHPGTRELYQKATTWAAGLN